VARARIEIPSARAETSAHIRSRSACSSSHPARETRVRTRRSRRPASIRSLIVTRPGLQPVPPAAGTGVVGYQIADYLDQHGRSTRRDQLGPASLWDALTTRTASASDLVRLAQAARDRGLYRHAAALWTTAVTLGSANAAGQLIGHLRRVSPGDTTRAAHWAADHVSPDDPDAVAGLLRELRAAGASDAVTALLARDPAGHVSPDDPDAVAGLLRELGAAGASDAVTALAVRAANAGMFDLFLEACPGEASGYPAGREPDGARSQTWKWQEPAAQNRSLRIRQPGA
jgi:hypothetical protein